MKEFQISLYKETQNHSMSTEDLNKLGRKVAPNPYTVSKKNVENFANAIGNRGYAFCPATFKDGKYGIETFEQVQLLVLCFQCPEKQKPPKKISIDSILDRIKKYKLQPVFVWDQFSIDFFWDAECGRFLIGFLMDIPLYDYRSAETAQKALLTMFPEARRYSSNITQIYQGGNKLIGVLKDLPTLNIEYLFMQMSLYLKDRYGATNYKRKLVEFSKETGLALNTRKYPSLSMVENHREKTIDRNNKILPKTIIDSNIVDGNILLNSNISYQINFIEDSFGKESSNSVQQGTKRSTYRSQDLNTLEDICPLYHKFISGDKMKVYEVLGLISNVCKIESGTAKIKEALHKRFKDKIVDQWSFYCNYMKDRDEKPCAAFCPYKDTCQHGRTMLSTLKPAYHKIERLYNDELSLVSIEDADIDFSHKFSEALDSSKRGWHVIKCQTALGKTRHILKLLEESYLKILIAVPTNLLKREEFDSADNTYDRIAVSPSLHEIKAELSEDLWDEIESIYSMGKSPWPMLSKLLWKAEEGKRTDENTKRKTNEITKKEINVLKRYQGELIKFKDSPCAITTHKRLTTMDLSKYDLVIVDEDIIFSTVIPSRESVTISKLKRLKKDLPSTDPLSKKIQKLLIERKKNEYFYAESIDFNDDYDEIKLEVNIRALCAAEYFYFQRADDLDSTASEDTIIFVNPVTFGVRKKDDTEDTENIKDTKFIMLSATASKPICEYVFGEENVTFYECAEAEISGRLNLYPEHSMSRSYLDKHIDIFDKIKKFTGVKHTITFKKFDEHCTTDMHFGNCSGSNMLKGKDIDIIGTPHQPEWVYKLFAFSLGYDVNEVLKPHTLVTHNGFRFRFTTYGDEVLRNIQFYLIESDLEQAVGRARLLRCNCTVNLFSNFPLRQSTLMEADF